MNKLIKLTLCFMVNVCAGFEFTDSNGKPTDPSMWCAPEKRDKFKQLCDTAIENLNDGYDSDETDSPPINVNDDNRTYLLMNIFSEKLEDENLIEEFKLQIPQNMSCSMSFKYKSPYMSHNVMKDFIKLIQNNYNVYKEQLIIENFNISSSKLLDIKKNAWKNTSTFLQINKCDFIGEYIEINLQHFPCNQYYFTDVNCSSVFLPIVPNCDIYSCESQVKIEIDESEYDADKQYYANITHVYIPESVTPNASSVREQFYTNVNDNIRHVFIPQSTSSNKVLYESDTSSNASSYKEQFYIEVGKHNLDNLHITIEKVQKEAYDLSTLLHAPNQSQGTSLSPRSSLASPTASESKGHSISVPNSYALKPIFKSAASNESNQSSTIHTPQSPRSSISPDDAQELEPEYSQVSLTSERLARASARLAYISHTQSSKTEPPKEEKPQIFTQNMFALPYSQMKKLYFHKYLLQKKTYKPCEHKKTQFDLPENIEELSESKIKKALQSSSRESHRKITITLMQRKSHQHKQTQCDFSNHEDSDI